MSGARKIDKPNNYGVKIYLEGIDPNTEGGKYYAEHREEISDAIVQELIKLVKKQVSEIINIRPTFYDECDEINTKLLSFRANKAFLATRIIHHSESSLNFMKKFLSLSNQFSDLSASGRIEFLKLSSQVSETAKKDVREITDLGKSWRKLPASPINSVPVALDDLKQQILALQHEFLVLVGVLPLHLQNNGYIKKIAQKFIDSEKQLVSGKALFNRVKNNSDDCKEFEALVERYLNLLPVANAKYQADYTKMIAVHEILTERESKLNNTESQLPPPPPPPFTATSTIGNKAQTGNIDQSAKTQARQVPPFGHLPQSVPNVNSARMASSQQIQAPPVVRPSHPLPPPQFIATVTNGNKAQAGNVDQTTRAQPRQAPLFGHPSQIIPNVNSARMANSQQAPAQPVGRPSHSVPPPSHAIPIPMNSNAPFFNGNNNARAMTQAASKPVPTVRNVSPV